MFTLFTPGAAFNFLDCHKKVGQIIVYIVYAWRGAAMKIFFKKYKENFFISRKSFIFAYRN